MLAHTGKAKAVDKRLVIYILTACFIVKHDSLMPWIWCVIDFLVACYPAETSNVSALEPADEFSVLGTCCVLSPCGAGG